MDDTLLAAVHNQKKHGAATVPPFLTSSRLSGLGKLLSQSVINVLLLTLLQKDQTFSYVGYENSLIAPLYEADVIISPCTTTADSP